MDHTFFIELLAKGGIAGCLMVAVWYVANKLAAAYEARIASLEKATEICEKDRIELRNMILERLSGPDNKTFKMNRESR